MEQARSKLAVARAKRHWTLEQAAVYIGVSKNALNGWEKGKTKPYAYNVALLCEKYEMTPEELGLDFEMFSLPKAVAQPGSRLRLFVENDLTSTVLALVFSSHPHLQGAIARAIEDYDAMHGNDPSSRVTRREALNRLVVLPYALLALGDELTQTNKQLFLDQCTAGIVAAWEHSKSTAYEDLLLAFEGVSDYLLGLQQIVKDSSLHRKEAAMLAAQCWHLKTLLAFHLEDPARATSYAQQGITYAKESGDPATEAVAWRQLADSYYYEHRREKALEAMQEAGTVLETAQKEPSRKDLLHKRQIVIPAQVQSWVYSGLAAFQAQHGYNQHALTSLGKAHTALHTAEDNQQYPDRQDNIADLLLWEGVTHYYRGQYASAFDTFGQAIDMNDEHYRAKVPMGERIRVEFLTHATLALLKNSEKDKKMAMQFWTAGIQGAKGLRSKQRFNEAAAAYDIMEAVWPNDNEIKGLKELLYH